MNIFIIYKNVRRGVKVDPQNRVEQVLERIYKKYPVTFGFELWHASQEFSKLIHCPVQKTFKQLETVEGDCFSLLCPMYCEWVVKVKCGENLTSIMVDNTVSVKKLRDVLESRHLHVEELMDGVCNLLDYESYTLRELGSPTFLIVN